MVLEHIAQRARLLIIPAPMLHAQCFRCRDLNMIYVAAVPDGFDDSVGEAEGQDVLYRLFAQIVVYAIDLLFLEDLMDAIVQVLRGGQIAPERLFDDDARPAIGPLVRSVPVRLCSPSRATMSA